MNPFDQVEHILWHARIKRLDDGRPLALSFGQTPTLELVEGDVHLFLRWADTLEHTTVRATPGPVAYLSVTGHMTGHLLAGHVVEVVVALPPGVLEAARLNGIVEVGQVAQMAKTWQQVPA